MDTDDYFNLGILITVAGFVIYLIFLVLMVSILLGKI